MGEGFDIRTAVRFLNIICGCTLFGLAIWSFVTLTELLDPLSVITYIYWIIFGALILATEFKLEFILKYFKFMEGTIGKGVFLVFAGMWVINGKLVADIIGGVLIGCGIVTTILLGVAGP